MTNFFTTLKESGLKQVSLGITYDDNTVTVSILPKTCASDQGLKKIKSLDLTASIEEMDRSFFETIQKPLQETKNTFNNVESYEKSLKASQKKTDAVKKQKESVSKLVAQLKCLVNAKDFNPMKDHAKALEKAKKILELSPNNKEAKAIENQMSQYVEPQLF